MWDNPRQLDIVALIVAVAALSVLAWAGGSWAVRQPIFAFQEVVIRGPLTMANPAHIEAVVREELKGTFFTMQLADARRSLARVPWVRSIALRRAWPRRLEVIVSEHEPLARWNDTALVNTHGETFAADYAGDLPQFNGPDGASQQVAQRFSEFGATLKATGLALGEIRLSERGGWELKTVGDRPLTLELGRVEPMARLERFVAYYAATIGRLQRAGTRVNQVDLRYRNGFAARVPEFREATAKKPAADQLRNKH